MMVEMVSDDGDDGGPGGGIFGGHDGGHNDCLNGDDGMVW
jgi:hypothetical protein